MTKFYQYYKYSFKDFDLLAEDGVIYACYLKTTPYPSDQDDLRKPNVYAMAKSIDGVHWEEVGDVILPIRNSWEENIWAGGISKQNSSYVIYYTGTTMKGSNDGCKIGKAYSTDLIHWQKDSTNPVFIFDSQNPYYSDEKKFAFRDPFFFEYKGRKYLLFCAKDKSKPAGKQGCVGIVEEKEPNVFRWMSPIFSPKMYSDGLECPAVYQVEDKWYLLYGVDKENGETAFRYAIAGSPFGPYKALNDNQLLASNNYGCRIIRFGEKNLLYHWFRDTLNGKIRERLAPPKEVCILEDGRISLLDFEYTEPDRI